MRFHKAKTVALGFGISMACGNATAYIGGGDQVIEQDSRYKYELTKREIHHSGAKSIQDVLTQIPGFYLASPFGSNRFLGYEGLSDHNISRLLVYVDDFPVDLPSSGAVYWEALPVDLKDVERIVYYPPHSTSRYGETAIQGVLRIYTTKGLSRDKINVETGENSHRNLYAQVNKASFGKRGATFVSASGQLSSTDGYHVTKDSDSTRKARVSVTRSQAGSNFNFSIGYGEEIRHEDVSPKEKSARTGRRKISNLLALASYTIRLTDSMRAELYGGINSIYSAAHATIATLPNMWTASPPVLHFVYDDKYESRRSFVGARLYAKMTDQVSVFAQAQYKHDNETPYRWSLFDKDWGNEYVSVSGVLSYTPAKNVKINLGANALNLNGVGFGRVNLTSSVDIAMKNGLVLKAGLSQAERVQNSWERFSQHHVYAEENPQIKAFRHRMNDDASRREMEDSAFVSLGKKWMGGGWSISYSRKDLYNLEYLKFVQTAMGTGAYPDPTTGQPYSAYLTIGRGDRYVIDRLEGFYRQKFNHALEGWVSASRVLGIDQGPGNVIDRKKTTPENVVSAGLIINSNGAEVIIEHRYVSRITWESAEMVDNTKDVKDYHTTDIEVRVKKPFQVDKDGRLYFGVKNLQGAYSDYYNYLKNDRRFYVGYGLDFN
ncbi:hypothetical protein D6779_08090 [Candidatus Parcubacteria bacterium]|nr:MAG: hypothetical protein D6779_08090 [Candidatus Parcubacteria bacterium]